MYINLYLLERAVLANNTSNIERLFVHSGVISAVKTAAGIIYPNDQAQFKNDLIDTM